MSCDLRHASIYLTFFLSIQFCLAQDFKINFSCLDQNQTHVQFLLPKFLESEIDIRQTKNTISISDDYLLTHDSCFILFNKNNLLQPLLFISTEEIIMTSTTSPMEFTIKILENFETSNKTVNQVSIKNIFSENNHIKMTQLKYFDVNAALFYCMVQFIVNNKLITIAVSNTDKKRSNALMEFISGVEINSP